MFKKVFVVVLIFISSTLFAQNRKSQWVDSVYNSLSLTEKVAQLLMVSVSAYGTPEQKQTQLGLLKKHKPGSILITQAGPVSHANLINKIQAASKVPFMVAIQAEYGVGQTLDSIISFPKPLLQGAVKNDSLLFLLGKQIAAEMKTLGIHLNFAPNADIHYHDDLFPRTLNYFGDNRERVSTKSIWLLQGLHAGGVLACAKHLENPKKNRNIIKQDSAIFFDVNQIDTIGFYPYLKLMEAGVDGLLTSHLDFVLQGKKKPVPAALSELFITQVVKQKLNYTGLTFSEIPYLKKLTRKSRDGEAEKLAFMIGNDVLVNPSNVGAAIKSISKLVKKDKALQNQLAISVKKILGAKYSAGLSESKLVNKDNLLIKLNSSKAKVLRQQLMESSISLLKNDDSLLPIQHLDHKKFASISFGAETTNEFTHVLSKYAPFQHYGIANLKDTVGLISKIKEDVTVVGLFPNSKGFILQIAPLVKKLSKIKRVIVVSFGYSDDIKFFSEIPTLLAAYSDDAQTQQVAAEIIFGGVTAKGALPITIADVFSEGKGLESTLQNRFSYAEPECQKMDSKVLQKIRSIMQEAVDAGATPGCQVLVARGGKIVYEQSVGWFTYDKKQPVTDQTIYDLASVTKVSATLQAVMFMHEKGLIDIHKKLSVYLPELKESNKKDFTIKDILTHQAGLWPFLPFWAQTVKDGQPLPEFYNRERSEAYPFPVADSLFATKAMKDSLWQWIIKAKVREKNDRTAFDYRYSDMGFYMLQHLSEKILNQPLEDFLEQNIYDPLGAYTIGYLPLQRFGASQIAPTEDDKLFRKKILTGYVHDQGAAMHGGIAGHAGLFGNAIDLAKLGQMWLQKGAYGGLRYFKAETIELFTSKQYETSRRGLGWDKPVPSDPNGPTSIYASAKTFGHTGFTGTCVWVDPEFDLVYVFLSNRVYPDMTNNKILNANIRPRIQDVIYQSIFNYTSNKQ